MTEKPLRIWALHCPFKKNGFPWMGSFGKTIEPVIVMKVSTWTQLCEKVPELGAMQLEVGTYD